MRRPTIMPLDANRGDIVDFFIVAAVAIFLIGLGTAATISVNPGESIQSAIDGADEGDVVVVQSGVYRENLIVDKPLTLVGESADGGRPVIDAGGSEDGITLKADGVTVRGLEITSSKIGMYVASSNNSIIGNEVRDGWTGMALRSSSGNVLKGNVVSDNWRGIYLKGSVNNYLSGNTVRDNRWSGVVLESSYNNLVEENLIQANYRGFELIDSDENTFIDNRLAENRYDEEPPSADLYRETSFDFWSEEGELAEAPSGETADAGDSEADDEPSGEVHDEDLGGLTSEMGLAGPEEPLVAAAEEGWNDPDLDTAATAADQEEATGLDMETTPLDIDEERIEPTVGGKSDEPAAEDAPSDALDESADTLGEDPPVKSSEKSKSGGVSGRPSTAPDDGPLAAESAVGAAFEEPIESEEPLEIDGPEPEPVDEAVEVVPVVGAEEEEEDLLEVVESVENATDVPFVDEDGSIRTKSSSGGWKIYEYLKSLRQRMGGEGTGSQPVPEEMNFSEMAEVEVDRLDLGTVSFYSAREMTVGVSETAEAAIAKDVQGVLKGRLEDLGASEAEVAGLSLSIKAVLEGEDFRIQPLDDGAASAAEGRIARWSWEVTPLKSGVQDLTLRILVVVDLPDGGQIEREHSPIERRVAVDLSFEHIVLYIVDRVADFTS